MKLTLKREDLLQGLQALQSVIVPNSPKPVLGNVLLEIKDGKMTITGTDETVRLQYNLPVSAQKNCASTFPARRLLNIIRELPGAELEIELDEQNTAFLRHESSRYRILGASADDFPPQPSLPVGGSLGIEQLAFREMLKKTIYAAATEENRQALSGVLLSFKDHKLTVVATDGRRLALVEQEMEIPADSQADVIVPAKTVHELIKVLGEEGALKIQAHSNLAAFDLGSILVVSKLVEGNYPNFRQVIPSQCEEHIDIDRESLLTALRRAALVTSDRHPSVKVCFQKNQLTIEAVTPDVGEAFESLPIKYAGKKITMAFNPEYIIDPLRALVNDVISIELVDEMSPAIIKCELPFLYVIMPLRLG